MDDMDFEDGEYYGQFGGVENRKKKPRPKHYLSGEIYAYIRTR